MLTSVIDGSAIGAGEKSKRIMPGSGGCGIANIATLMCAAHVLHIARKLSKNDASSRRTLEQMTARMVFMSHTQCVSVSKVWIENGEYHDMSMVSDAIVC